MKTLVLALAAAMLPASLAVAQEAGYDGMMPRYATPPRPDYFYEPNYRPPGKEPSRTDFVIGVDAGEYRHDPRPRPHPPRPGPRPRGHGYGPGPGR